MRFFIPLLSLITLNTLLADTIDKSHNIKTSTLAISSIKNRTSLKATQKALLNSKEIATKTEQAYFAKDLLKLNDKEFIHRYARYSGMNWASKSKKQLRGVLNGTFNSHKIYESQVFFNENQHVEKMELSLFNKGDSANISFSRYTKIVESLQKHITKITGTKARLKKDKSSNKQKKNTYFWVNSGKLYRIDFAYTKQIPEYVKVSVRKGEGKINLINIDTHDKKNLNENHFRARVVQKENGDVFISGIPMVDQGAKGYCACATTARILQFYGKDVDQHEIAQRANSGPSTGTNPEELKKALKRIQGKYSLRFREMGSFPLSSMKNIVRFIEKLGREALPKKVFSQYRRDPYNLSTLAFGKLQKMERQEAEELLIKAGIRNESKYKSFYRDIKRAIDNGRPIAWALYLGLVREEKLNPQVRGGHMRLIIGYNEQTEEILFSDSWGQGHELKRMKAKLAYIPSMAVWEIGAR